MRVNDIKELFDVLINMKIFKNIKFWKNSIEISPYKNLTIKVVETTYFDIYFNNFFYYSFENEEILDFINELTHGKYVIIEKIDKKNNSSIDIVSTKKFTQKIQKYLTQSNIKIYSFKKQIK